MSRTRQVPLPAHRPYGIKLAIEDVRVGLQVEVHRADAATTFVLDDVRQRRHDNLAGMVRILGRRVPKARSEAMRHGRDPEALEQPCPALPVVVASSARFTNTIGLSPPPCFRATFEDLQFRPEFASLWGLLAQGRRAYSATDRESGRYAL